MNTNVTAGYNHSAAFTYQRSARVDDVQKAMASSSRWNIPDTVEISSQSRKFALEHADEVPLVLNEPGADFTAEDLAAVKERFAELAGQRKALNAKLQSLIKSSGIELKAIDQVKVEIGPDGKAIVGGVSDAKKAQKLEKAINDDPDLLEEIKAFHKEENEVSRELRSITGKSLNDYSDRLSMLQKSPGKEEGHIYSFDGVDYTLDDLLALKDQKLTMVDDEFGQMLVDYISSRSTETANFSGTNNILEDADGTVTKKVEAIIKKVKEYLAEVNKGLRMQYDDPEELERHLVSLEDMVINVSSDGLVKYDGMLCEDRDTHRVVMEGVERIFDEELQYNPYTGEQDDFYVAAQYLENVYDLAFDGVDKDRMLVTTYENGKVQSRISSPVEEERLREEIAIQGKVALFGMGIDATNLDVGVDDDGKLFVLNLPEDEAEADRVEQALKMLNSQVEKRSNEDYNALDITSGPVGRLKGLMAKLDVFLPGGTAVLQKMQPATEAE